MLRRTQHHFLPRFALQWRLQLGLSQHRHRLRASQRQASRLWKLRQRSLRGTDPFHLSSANRRHRSGHTLIERIDSGVNFGVGPEGQLGGAIGAGPQAVTANKPKSPKAIRGRLRTKPRSGPNFVRFNMDFPVIVTWALSPWASFPYAAERGKATIRNTRRRRQVKMRRPLAV